MATSDQIKNEIFISLRKRIHDPAVNDIVILNLVRSALTKKYRYELTAEDFNTIGDELTNAGFFRWNDDGRLALTTTGLHYLGTLK